MSGMAVRKWTLPLAVACALACSSATMAEDVGTSFIDHVARQIICRSPPDPTPMLFYLSKRKRLDLKKGQRVDSETCWAIRPPVALDGVTFTYVCASSEDPLLIELFPLLYYRGPGTSPGTGIRLVTNDDEAAVDAWIERAKSRLGLPGETKLDIGEPTLVEGKTEISCNSTSFPAGN
jgi:hypothetical protein